MIKVLASNGESSLNQAVRGYGLKRARFPFKTYIGFMATYNFLLAAYLWKGKLANRDHRQLTWQDLALLGVATHKLSRVITKDIITSPLRAPFTRYHELLGYGEVQEDGRGHGIQQGIGELISCNYCADPWIALGLLYFLEAFPEKGRFVLKLFSSVALADFLHVFYETTRTRENVLTLREEALAKRKKKAA